MSANTDVLMTKADLDNIDENIREMNTQLQLEQARTDWLVKQLEATRDALHYWMKYVHLRDLTDEDWIKFRQDGALSR